MLLVQCSDEHICFVFFLFAFLLRCDQTSWSESHSSASVGLMAAAAEDPVLGSGPDDDDTSRWDSESDSILSDDSVLPDYTQERANSSAANTLYEACARNDSAALQKLLERGVTEEEVTELDHNGWVRIYFMVRVGFSFEAQSSNYCLSLISANRMVSWWLVAKVF